MNTKPFSPSVSVVMPVYNCGPEIARGILSVVNQTDVETELIIVDDGSHSETRVIMKRAARQHPRAKVIRQSNAGPGAARNRGIQEASCDWIAFLDHDDEWHSEKLSRQLQAAEKDKADVVYCAARNVGSVDRVDQVRQTPESFPAKSAHKELLSDNFITLSSVLAKRSLLANGGGFDERWRGVEDWALWLRLAREGCRFTGVNEALVDYNWGDSSLSRAHGRMQLQRKRLIEEELATAEGRSLPITCRRKILAAERLCSAWFMAGSSHYKAGLIYLQAISYWPFNWTPWKGLAKSILQVN